MKSVFHLRVRSVTVCMEPKGAFMLTETEIETDKLQQYSMALLSMCSVTTSVLLYNPFLSVSVSV